MLQGFTEDWLTSDEYNEAERKAFPIIIKGLSAKIGKENAVTNDYMRAVLLRDYNIKIGSPRLRKMINLIRNKLIIPGLVASSKGYYVTEDPQEVERWINSLDGRICAMMELMERAKDYFHTLTTNKTKIA